MRITILCGKSASGKDYMLKKMVNEYGYKPLISYTDRPIREDEVNGVEYYFKTKKEFDCLIDNNELIEHREYNTCVNGIKDIWRYGLGKLKLDDKEYVTIMDLEGAKSLIKYYGDENCRILYLHAPLSVRKKRCVKRGDYNKKEFERRAREDDLDFDIEKNKEFFSKAISIDTSHDVNYDKYVSFLLTK